MSKTLILKRSHRCESHTHSANDTRMFLCRLDSSASIVTKHRAGQQGNQGCITGSDRRFSLSSPKPTSWFRSQPLLKNSPFGDKAAKTGSWPLTSIKNAWRHTSIPPYALTGENLTSRCKPTFDYGNSDVWNGGGIAPLLGRNTEFFTDIYHGFPQSTQQKCRYRT